MHHTLGEIHRFNQIMILACESIGWHRVTEGRSPEGVWTRSLPGTVQTVRDGVVSAQSGAVVPCRTLRTCRGCTMSSSSLLCFSCRSSGRRAFSHAGLYYWNSLPYNVQNSVSITSFKRSLKTRLFRSNTLLSIFKK